MNNSKLNATIAAYANSSNYDGAIMLTAEWGAGKSYYLQAELIPYLNNNGIKTLVVSLHGLNNDFEISKAIYVEYLLSIDRKRIVRDSSLNYKCTKEKLSHAAFVAKTIVRGVASHFNIDLSCSEKDLKKLYNSIDLSDTLVIFEDVERSNMSAKNIMAYINNMAEYDHTKVLLITNENELKNSENADEYKNIKEKTVGDTLLFKGDQVQAINNMMNYFSEETIGPFLKNEKSNGDLAKEIVSEIKGPTINLRSIKFGFSKFNEMMSLADNNIDESFEKSLLISTLVFVHKYRKDNTINWNGNEDTSPELASYNYPLHRFVFDFITKNDFEIESFSVKQKEFINYQNKEKAKASLNDKLSVLYSCYTQKEADVKDVILFIRESLKDISIIPLELYFKIANYLIYIKHVIDFDKEIDDCLNQMKDNLKQIKEERFEDISYFGGIALDDREASKEFKQFREDVSAIVKKNKMNPLNFSYKLSDLDSFCEEADKSKDTYITDRAFAVKLDISKLVELIKECSAQQINRLRQVFLNIYASVNIRDFLSNDLLSLKDLLEGIKSIKDEACFDSIQKKQILYFISNLEEIIERLERGY